MQSRSLIVVQNRGGNNLLTLKLLQSTLEIFTGEELLVIVHSSTFHSYYNNIICCSLGMRLALVACSTLWTLVFIHSHFSQEHKAEGILKTVLASLQEKCGENSAEVAYALQGLGLAYDKLQLYDESL